MNKGKKPWRLETREAMAMVDGDWIGGVGHEFDSDEVLPVTAVTTEEIEKWKDND